MPDDEADADDISLTQPASATTAVAAEAAAKRTPASSPQRPVPIDSPIGTPGTQAYSPLLARPGSARRSLGFSPRLPTTPTTNASTQDAQAVSPLQSSPAPDAASNAQSKRDSEVADMPLAGKEHPMTTLVPDSHLPQSEHDLECDSTRYSSSPSDSECDSPTVQQSPASSSASPHLSHAVSAQPATRDDSDVDRQVLRSNQWLP